MVTSRHGRSRADRCDKVAAFSDTSHIRLRASRHLNACLTKHSPERRFQDAIERASRCFDTFGISYHVSDDHSRESDRCDAEYSSHMFTYPDLTPGGGLNVSFPPGPFSDNGGVDSL